MASMQLRTFIEPQFGATYDDQLAVAQATEAGGFDAFFRSDHFLTMGGDGLPGPTDSWLTLAGLARETSRIQLGTMVTSATFRLPGMLAVSVAQVSQMSGGRVELGLGSGWYEQEHTAYGVPFPSLAERFERLEEQLEIITGMWGTPVGELFTHQGKHYALTDSPALPKPVAPVPIIVGGWGTKRTPRLAARFAAEFNVPFGTVPDVAAGIGRVREAAGDRQLVYSTAQVVACGKDTAELERRIRATGRDPQQPGQDGLFGTPDDVIARLREFAAAGASRVYLQLLDVHDLDHIDLLAREVLPAVADL
jgi:F420-dependent oxidoreductase-like protein